MPEPDPTPRRGQHPAGSSPASRPPDPRPPAAADVFAEFYRATVKPLTRFLMYHGASVVDAAEIAQDTLARAYTHWASIEEPRAWSFRVASRELIRRASSVQHDLTADPAEPSPLLRCVPTDAWHLRHELLTALAGLPPRQRQVMAWTLAGYKPAEIAEELHLTSEQVRSNLRLARRAMSINLTDGDEDRP